MFLDHARSSAAQGLSGSDEIQRLQLKDLTADNPGHAHPVKTAVNDEDGNQAGTDFLQSMKHGHRIDEVLQGFADDHFDDNNKKDLRHRIDDIHHTHHDDIDFAADESGDGSVNASHDHNDHGGYQTDDHGNPGTDHAADQNVTAQTVGSEGMFETGPQCLVSSYLLIVGIGRKQRADEGENKHDHDKHQGHHGNLIGF